MNNLRKTITCPTEKAQEIIDALKKINIEDVNVKEVDQSDFIEESRLYWDYVFPEMQSDHKPVTYISFEFDDTPEGRQACHHAEWSIGWIPQNIRYVER